MNILAFVSFIAVMDPSRAVFCSNNYVCYIKLSTGVKVSCSLLLIYNYGVQSGLIHNLYYCAYCIQ